MAVITIDQENQPTTVLNKIRDLLNFFISRKVSHNFIKVEENVYLDSDHSSIILTLSEKVIKRTARSALANKTADWECFKIDHQNGINLNTNMKPELSR